MLWVMRVKHGDNIKTLDDANRYLHPFFSMAAICIYVFRVFLTLNLSFRASGCYIKMSEMTRTSSRWALVTICYEHEMGQGWLRGWSRG